MPNSEKIQLVAVAPISDEAYAPYGQVFGSRPGHPDGRGFTGEPMSSADLSGGRVAMSLLTVRLRDFTFTHMEQHASFTQAFLPADGQPVVSVVCRPKGEPGSEPDLSTIKAFLLDGTQGILLGKGTWHCPLYPVTEKATYALITCVDTPKETEGYLDISEIAGHKFRLAF